MITASFHSHAEPNEDEEDNRFTQAVLNELRWYCTSNIRE